MNKFCVFCGAKPEPKSKEHIIPKWLIELTGEPRRDVYLGRKWNTLSLEKRNYALSSLTFPACASCNHSSSQLEHSVKQVVTNMLIRERISEAGIDTLLDWLDKIRTGIWLAMIYLNENYRGIDPLFYIAKRIAAKDRFVIIYGIDEDNRKGVSWLGTDTPLFHYMPSCFGLAINNIMLLNASKDFLFSKRIGFPYMVPTSIRDMGGYFGDVREGTGRMRMPLVARKFKSGGTQLFQPIIPYKSIYDENGVPANIDEMYNTEYVQAHCLDFAKGKGIILKRDRDKFIRYSQMSSLDWLPKQSFPRGEVFFEVGLEIGTYQEELFLDMPSIEGLSDDAKAYRKTQSEGAVKLHRLIMDHLRKQKDKYINCL